MQDTLGYRSWIYQDSQGPGIQHFRSGYRKMQEYCNTLDTKGCRILEVGGRDTTG
jgi:hypothetical protein